MVLMEFNMNPRINNYQPTISYNLYPLTPP